MSNATTAFRRSILGSWESAPRSVKAIVWATVAWAALTVCSALALLSQRNYIADRLLEANRTAKNPRANYDRAAALQDATNSMDPRLLVAGLTAIILLLLGILVLRANRVAKWLLVGMATVLPVLFPFGTGVLFQLAGGISAGGAPVLFRGSLILAGLCALAVAVLMFMPATKAFYQLAHPPNPDVVARPSLFGSLFRPGAARTAAPAADTKAINRAKSKAIADRDATPAPEDVVARPGSAKRTATRPGSVKSKATGPRAKSRNQ